MKKKREAETVQPKRTQRSSIEDLFAFGILFLSKFVFLSNILCASACVGNKGKQSRLSVLAMKKKEEEVTNKQNKNNNGNEICIVNELPIS